MTDQEKLAQAADLLRLQSAKIRELRAEVARLNRVIENSCDALTILQRIYSDPRNPTFAHHESGRGRYRF